MDPGVVVKLPQGYFSIIVFLLYLRYNGTTVENTTSPGGFLASHVQGESHYA